MREPTQDIDFSRRRHCAETEMAYRNRTLTEKEIGETLDKFSSDIEEVVNSFAREMDAKPPPRIIYHYTDSRGLGGILESGRIRLTDIFGLNDPTELRHGLSPAIKFLDAARRDDRFEIKQILRKCRGDVARD
jgi:hypothetical protein